jgi:hypothetical protein
MELQYVSDEKGRHTAVIIPISEWNDINFRLNKAETIPTIKKKPSDFVGCISRETADKMNADISQSRNE